MSPYRDPGERRRANREAQRRRRMKMPAEPEVCLDGEWRTKAACRGYPTAWWYEVDGRGSPNNPKSYAQALPICKECPVQAECLAEADATEPIAELRIFQGSQIHGMRAGLTPLERWRRRKNPRRNRSINPQADREKMVV